MEIASLAYRTDLFFPQFDGSVTEGDGYLVVRTPRNPGYYWGNYLLFPEPPGPDDTSHWPELFAREFPGAAHVALGWDWTGEVADASAFAELGYELTCELVMVAEEARSSTKPASGIAIRPLESDLDWEKMIELNRAGDPNETDESYRAFKAALRRRYREMVADGLGVWLGAFDGDALVGQMGLFFTGDDLGRFQSVETHPDHRRRGICSSLVAEANRIGFEERGLDRIVCVAEPDYHAAEIYGAAGFETRQRQQGVYRKPEGRKPSGSRPGS